MKHQLGKTAVYKLYPILWYFRHVYEVEERERFKETVQTTRKVFEKQPFKQVELNIPEIIEEDDVEYAFVKGMIQIQILLKCKNITLKWMCVRELLKL